MSKDLVLAGSYEEFRRACALNQVNHNDYRYMTAIHDFRGYKDPKIHLVGQYYKNPLWKSEQFYDECRMRNVEIVKGMIDWMGVPVIPTDLFDQEYNATESSKPEPVLTLDTLRKAIESFQQSRPFIPHPAQTFLYRNKFEEPGQQEAKEIVQGWIAEIKQRLNL